MTAIPQFYTYHTYNKHYFIRIDWNPSYLSLLYDIRSYDIKKTYCYIDFVVLLFHISIGKYKTNKSW